ncbi:MAG TPA: carbohydrate binding domain-containing protein [Gemmataceae bacterium]|nr:carbohydrate binding domain-containing protein [Gemmataceae bacterium]
MKRATLMLAALALLLSGVGQARADLIVNGGFETGDFTGWTVGANSYPESIVTSPVHSGMYAAQIAGYSYDPDTLSQTIATSAGQAYTLSFWRDVAGGGPTELLNVYWDGVQKFSELNPGAQPYQEFSFQVVGTGSDTLEFQCANDPSFTYLDDVSLDPSSSAAPEPSSFVLFGSALFTGLGYLGWRRRKLASA